MPTSPSGVPYWYTKPMIHAWCHNCEGRWERNGKGVAARHAKATGHVCTVEESRSYIYGESSPGENPAGPYGG